MVLEVWHKSWTRHFAVQADVSGGCRDVAQLRPHHAEDTLDQQFCKRLLAATHIADAGLRIAVGRDA